MWDYMNKKTNLEVYGEGFEVNPPIIDVSQITDSVPIALYVGDKDDLATIYDNDWLYSELGDDIVISYEILENFGHSTFNFGRNQTYFNKIAEQIATYNPLPEEIKVQVESIELSFDE